MVNSLSCKFVHVVIVPNKRLITAVEEQLLLLSYYQESSYTIINIAKNGVLLNLLNTGTTLLRETSSYYMRYTQFTGVRCLSRRSPETAVYFGSTIQTSRS
jgi:hypothetical protein